MKKNPPLDKTFYNVEVKKAYSCIIKQAIKLLAAIDQEELRFVLERRDAKSSEIGIIHEFVNPILYLRLERHTDGIIAIHFGIEQINQLGLLSEITTTFLRLLYKYTSKEATASNIENCVRTDWFINSYSAAYEYIEQRNKYHEFKQIKFKTSKPHRKSILSVA
ncbi:MAG TPA: hypothetical protein VK671_00440 [Mucilaginibacter sp.]|jgi:hypothetical protein|nr:hypothetical protein [Mucilaginibacter sp.]